MTLHFPESVPRNNEVLRLVAIRHKIHTFEVDKNFGIVIDKGIDLIPTARSKTFDTYLKVEFWVGCHEPPHVRQYLHTNNRNIDRSDVTECDWEAYEARLGPLWSGSRTKYMLQELSWKVERADMLLMEMKKVYNPAFDKDPQFGYNFDEHEDGMGDGQTLDNGDDVGTKDESRPVMNSEGKKPCEIDEDEEDDDGKYGTQTKKQKGARNSKQRGQGKR
ncbi:hypothetical protein L210DRAFT_931441 [Boletus edulis BED1]|uniref:Uncharacterized protein n=1 Tax=Boletus edulis BED1 TaxID=1328754 RepID=A0AAD4GE46_BOLED|nr:hypothetical protein L210DRAFT_931441 [Boletus edulis BED1]